MSAESQNVVLEFKIQDSSLAKLKQIMSGESTGGGKGGDQSGGGAKGIGKLQGAFNKGSLGQIAKLSGIALGVIGVIGLVKKITSMMITASPMLQSMLKLFNTSVLFILRPIGDFIGFLLRPMMIYFLRTIAIPWYRKMTPLMRMWGTDLGTGLVSFIKDPFTKLSEALEGTSWANLITAVGGWFTGVGIVAILQNILGAIGIKDVDSATTFILGAEFKDMIFQAGVDAAEYWRQAGRDSAAYWRDMGTEAGNTIRQAGVDAAAWWRALGQSTGDVFRNAGKAVGDAIFDLGVSFGFWWTGLQSDLTTIGNNISEGIGVVFDGINQAWNNLIPSIESAVDTVGSALSGFGSYLMVNLAGIGNFIHPHIESFIGLFRDRLGSIWDFIGNHYNTFINFWSAIGSGTITLSTIWDRIIAFFEDIGNWISTFDIGEAISGIGDAIGGGINNIVNGGNSSSQDFSGTVNQYYSGGDTPTWEDVFGIFQDSSSRRGNQ